MIKYQIPLFCILLSILTSCMVCLLDGYEYSEQADLVHEILGKTSKKLEKKHQMSAIGTGIGMPGGIVEMLALSFEKTGPISKDLAREIAIDCVQEMVTAVNTNERIKPYLKNYPFNAKNIKIAIFLKDKSRNEIYAPDFGVVSATCGDIEYLITGLENPYRYKEVIKENFDEMLKKVNRKRDQAD
jgi:hypothetical protein